MMKQSQSYFQTFIFLIVLSAVLLIGCGSDDGGDEGANESLEDVVVATPTSPPTATPIPTATEFIPPTATPENASGSILTDIGVSDAPTVESEVLPVQNQEIIEPQVVSINFRQAILNDWITLQQPPPGWIMSEGLDGVILTQSPEMLPNDAFILVRRWGNVVNLSDWVAYLPDGFEERDSNVTIRMGGFDWDGVFLTNNENSYRAFFAVSNDGIPAYTMLVYVPYPTEAPPSTETAGDTSTNSDAPLTRETLLAHWDATVGDMNQILRRFIFS